MTLNKPQQSRSRQLHPRIESDPGILQGKPIMQGSRLTVEAILENFASGYSFDDLLDIYPFLTHKDAIAPLSTQRGSLLNPLALHLRSKPSREDSGRCVYRPPSDCLAPCRRA